MPRTTCHPHLFDFPVILHRIFALFNGLYMKATVEEMILLVQEVVMISPREAKVGHHWYLLFKNHRFFL